MKCENNTVAQLLSSKIVCSEQQVFVPHLESKWKALLPPEHESEFYIAYIDIVYSAK